jgi:hypothetical protein
MPSATPINPKIQEALNEKRKVYSRSGEDNPYTSRSKKAKSKYLTTIQKTPYLYMLSTESIQEKRRNAEKTQNKFNERESVAKTGRLQEEDIVEDTSYLGGNFQKGPILISNTEYSDWAGKNIRFGLDAYQAKGDRKYRPNAGIKGLTSEYLSSGQQAFVRKITVNWTCFTLEDLDFLQERFMTLGRKVYVEWGWASTKMNKVPIFLIDIDGTYVVKEGLVNDTKPSQDYPKGESAALKLKKEVLESGGSFDAIIGYVDGFEFSQRDDGGFDCTTNLTVNGGNIFQTKKEPKKEVKPGKLNEIGIKKAQDGFIDSINKLPRILNEYIDKSSNKPTSAEIYKDYTTADSFESEIINKDKFWKAEKRKTTVKNLTNKSSEYKYNNNCILKVDTIRQLDESVKTGFAEKGLKGWWDGMDEEDGINRQLIKEQRQQSGEGVFHIADRDVKEEIVPNECWVRWGWFEDNILNKYFALLDTEGEVVNVKKTIRSIKPVKIGEEDAPKINIGTERKQIPDYDLDNYRSSGKYKKIRTEDGKQTYEAIVMGTDYESTTCGNHLEFKTPNINNFIFPGQFSLKDKGYDKALVGEQGETRFEAKKRDNPEEYNFAKDFEKYLQRYNVTEGTGAYGGTSKADMMMGITPGKPTLVRQTLTLPELQQKLKDFKISTKDLDMNETAIVPYLELKVLENVVKELPLFGTGDKNKDGKIRNIFVNVSKLQDIFKTPTDNIMGNMNLFFRSLLQETQGLINLKLKEDEEGNTQVESNEVTESESINLIELENNDSPDGIYEFPVNTNDSFVESQEISSDMGSSLQQMMMSKQFASQAIKDNKGNVIAQAMVDGIIGESKIIKVGDDDIDKEIGTSVPALMEGWENFGQIEGNEDFPFEQGGGASTNVPLTPEEIKERDTTSSEEYGVESSEKDAEQGLAIYNDAISADYDIDGKLKNVGGMFDKVGTTKPTQTTTTGKDGKEETYEIVPTTEATWGLLFITNTIEITGIAGIKPGDIWTTSYLPKKFKDNAHFWTTNVSQTIDSSGWKTTITGRVNKRLKKIEK